MTTHQRRHNDINDDSIDELLQKSDSEEIKVLGLFVKRVVNVLTDISQSLHEQHRMTLDNQEKLIHELNTLTGRINEHERRDLLDHAEDRVLYERAKTSYWFWLKIFGAISTGAVVLLGLMYDEYKTISNDVNDMLNRLSVVERNVTFNETRLIELHGELTELNVDKVNKAVKSISKKRSVIFSK